MIGWGWGRERESDYLNGRKSHGDPNCVCSLVILQSHLTGLSLVGWQCKGTGFGARLLGFESWLCHLPDL